MSFLTVRHSTVYHYREPCPSANIACSSARAKVTTCA